MIEKAVSLKTQIYKMIREAIVAKQIRKDRIYSEQFFADLLRVSRTPVREALLQLRSEGFIDSLPNRGFIVRHLTQKDAKNIYQMRASIEGYCSAYLAQNAKSAKGKATLAIIDQSLEYSKFQMEQNIQIEQSKEMTIHIAAINFSENPLFIKQFHQMRAMIDVFWRDVISVPCRVSEVYAEHLKIAKCMHSGDYIGAYLASQEHSLITLKRILDMAIFDKPGELKPAVLEEEERLLSELMNDHLN